MGQIPDTCQGDFSPELLSGSQITHNLHRTHATHTEASLLIPGEAGACMYRAQKLPRKALTVHSRYSVFQEITVSGAPRVSYSCRLEKRHSPVPGLARVCILWLILRNLYSASPTAEHFCSCICTRDDMSCLHMSESPLHWLYPSESSWPARQQCKLCRAPAWVTGCAKSNTRDLIFHLGGLYNHH